MLNNLSRLFCLVPIWHKCVSIGLFCDKSVRKWKRKADGDNFFAGGWKGRGWGERGGMFNKTQRDFLIKVEEKISTKFIWQFFKSHSLLIEVCESSIELSNIKSLNVNTLMFQQAQQFGDGLPSKMRNKFVGWWHLIWIWILWKLFVASARLFWKVHWCGYFMNMPKSFHSIAASRLPLSNVLYFKLPLNIKRIFP